MTRPRFASIALAVGLALGAVGITACVKPTTANIPGSVSNVDAQIYVALSDLQTAIQEAQKMQPQYPAIKPILDNQIGPAYQKARDAGEAYHKALAAGKPVDSTVLNQIQAVKAALTAALKQVGVK